MDEDFDEIQQETQMMQKYDYTDEDRIQMAIDEFYTVTKTLYGETERLTLDEKISHMKNIRNSIINITDTCLKKFNNKMIMKDFYKKLKEAKENAINNGSINKYKQYMNEIRVVQEFKEVKTNISDKLAIQLFEEWEKWELERRAK